MLGYSKEELETMGVEDIHPKEDLPIVFREFMRMVSMEHSKASHLPVLRKDGSVFIADIYAVRLELDGVMSLCGVFSDLTEAIASENRILEEKAKAEVSETKYRLLFENSPVGVVATDDKGQILLINKTLTELTGYSTLDFNSIDQWWSIAYPDIEYRNQLMEAWNKAVVESMMTKKSHASSGSYGVL
ncbi:MAG: PAS domain-containing protein [Chitinophagaceae bacterium]|nr:PAS domain-containing protein [Chitinophagaceae bacterium]